MQTGIAEEKSVETGMSQGRSRRKGDDSVQTENSDE